MGVIRKAFLGVLLLSLSLFQVAVLADEGSSSSEGETPRVKLWKPSGRKVHDPWKVFCGKTLCYDLLEVNEDATEAEIKKSFRKLAREWHPDKNPEKGAREKFQKIAKAYEVLSTEGERAKYDHLMKNPAEYRKTYGEYYFKVVAPPTDVTLVILFLLAAFSGIHYVLLREQKRDYDSKLTKLCVANKGRTAGGSAEIVEAHGVALKRYLAKTGKTEAKEKALLNDKEFEQTVVEVLGEKGYLKEEPKLTSLFAFQLLKLPMWLYSTLSFHLSWFINHTIMKQPLSDEEKMYVLESNVPGWDRMSSEEQNKLFENESWRPEKLERLVKKLQQEAAKKEAKKNKQK